MRTAAITDIGKHRKRNEDRYLIDEDRNLFVVCDGMGGHKGGDVASQLAVDTFRSSLVWSGSEQIGEALQDAVQQANRLVYELGQRDESLHEMGTTITAAVVADGKITVAHVGDSSLFLFQDHNIRKITHDHTLAEQMITDGLIRQFELSASAYNHVLTRAVGINALVEADIYEAQVGSGDRILICSDGLTDMVTQEEIGQHLGAARDLQDSARALVDTALRRGGYDNVTVVLISI